MTTGLNYLGEVGRRLLYFDLDGMKQTARDVPNFGIDKRYDSAKREENRVCAFVSSQNCGWLATANPLFREEVALCQPLPLSPPRFAHIEYVFFYMYDFRNV